MKFTIAALATALSAGTALAGGYVAPVVEAQPVVAQPVATVAPSDWSGFYAGLQYGQGDVELSQDGDAADEDFDAFGVHGGYQRYFGRFVLGGELDYNRLDLDTTGDADLIRLRGRAGYDLGRFLPYASLGAAHISSGEDGGNLSETGLVYGLGMDFKVTERLTVGAEYTRHDFDDVADVDGLDLQADMIQIRGSFRF